ncbi:MAG: AAA family ATPase, partial [Oscillospiraceae bacterium]|nr:AAA family ATPase [Oscillospiraceae bacterium]
MTNNNSIKTVRLIIDEVKKAVIGKDKIIIKILLAVLSRGHILLEDIPGVGKTTLALAFSKALSLDYNRVQFTPDVLPTDITGFTVYNKHTGSFEFKPGASMTNLLLADEINRTSSKTQSALLEIMEEGKVTVDGVTHELPKPFIVMATQNPIGSVGTQELPESQLDRFMIKISMGYPDLESETEILKLKSNYSPLDFISEVADTETLISL